MEYRFSPSVKGKRVLARNRATKILSKTNTGDVGIQSLSKTAVVWISRGSNGDGECSESPFKFSANGSTRMGTQDRRQECGKFGDRYGEDQNEDNAGDAMDQSKVEVCEGGLCKIGSSDPLGAKGSFAHANAIIQKPYSGEEVESGCVGTSDVSAFKKGDGMDGMEMEEGSKELASSV